MLPAGCPWLQSPSLAGSAAWSSDQPSRPDVHPHAAPTSGSPSSPRCPSGNPTGGNMVFFSTAMRRIYGDGTGEIMLTQSRIVKPSRIVIPETFKNVGMLGYIMGHSWGSLLPGSAPGRHRHPSRGSQRVVFIRHTMVRYGSSIDWFKGKITGKTHISWEYLWFPVDFPLSQPIEVNNSMDWGSYSHVPKRRKMI